MKHVAEHNISYGTIEEFNFRHNLFTEVDRIINEHNADPTNTEVLGHNFLSTWTLSERKQLLGYRASEEFGEIDDAYVEVKESNSSGIDWRVHNAVNPVQSQGHCGSCWAFSATAAVEGVHAVMTGELVKLSEEQLVQCVEHSSGCDGGSMRASFKYLMDKGQNTAEAYPYTSGEDHHTGHCDTSKEGGRVKTTGYSKVPHNDAEALKFAIEQGVVSVAVEAGHSVFSHYKSGIVTSSSCGTNVNHGVAAVGWGHEHGQDYFIVRNSWGVNWGDNGYIKIGVKDGEGICGIQKDACLPRTN